MDYFPHDTRAISDDKLLALRIEDGLEAIACYWVVLEKIYADEKPFDISETNVGSSTEARSVSYKLGIGFDVLRKYVFDMVRVGLLYFVDCDGEVVMSERAKEQIEALDRKREIARQNGKSGGRKPAGKPNGKQKETNVGSNGKPKSAAYKTLNGIGSYKKEPIPNGSVGADADKSAPPSPSDDTSVPTCPLCSKRVSFNARNGKWHCDMCGDVKEPVYREAVA